jgi:hypothetical protein
MPQEGAQLGADRRIEGLDRWTRGTSGFTDLVEAPLDRGNVVVRLKEIVDRPEPLP